MRWKTQSDYGRQSENSGFGNSLRNRKEIRAGLNSFLSAIDRTHSRCVISFPSAAAVSSASIASSHRISHARAILIIPSKPGNRWLLDHRYHLLKEQNKASPSYRATFCFIIDPITNVSASRKRDVFCEIRLICTQKRIVTFY